MNGRGSLVRRYALALAELAAEKGVLDEVERGLAAVLEALERDEELSGAWYGVKLSASEKVKLLRRQLGDRVHDLVFKFAGVVAAKAREHLLPHIVQQFALEADRMREIVRVEAESAAPLSGEERRELERRLAALLGARAVRLSVRVRPDLIGGLVVYAGDLRIDGSLARQLQLLHEKLRAAPLDGLLAVDRA